MCQPSRIVTQTQRVIFLMLITIPLAFSSCTNQSGTALESKTAPDTQAPIAIEPTVDPNVDWFQQPDPPLENEGGELAATTHVDQSFGNQGVIRLEEGSDLQFINMERIQISLDEKSIFEIERVSDPDSVFRIAKYGLTGKLDLAFGRDGYGYIPKTLAPNVNSFSGEAKMTVHEKGIYVLVEQQTPVYGNQVFRLTYQGNLDQTFGKGGSSILIGESPFRSSAISKIGQVYVANHEGIYLLNQEGLLSKKLLGVENKYRNGFSGAVFRDQYIIYDLVGTNYWENPKHETYKYDFSNKASEKIGEHSSSSGSSFEYSSYFADRYYTCSMIEDNRSNNYYFNFYRNDNFGIRNRIISGESREISCGGFRVNTSSIVFSRPRFERNGQKISFVIRGYDLDGNLNTQFGANGERTLFQIQNAHSLSLFSQRGRDYLISERSMVRLTNVVEVAR
jgi:hypothetical protein